MEKKDNLLTIKEFAKYAGVTPQSIYQRIDTSLKEYSKNIKGQKYIEKRALKEIYNISIEQEEQQEIKDIKQENKQIEQSFIFEEKIKMLEQLLTEKDKRIEQLINVYSTEIERYREDIDYFKQELEKANDRADEDKRIIKMLTAQKTLEIEQKEQEEITKKGIWNKLFNKQSL